jgi:hypothetical protein
LISLFLRQSTEIFPCFCHKLTSIIENQKCYPILYSIFIFKSRGEAPTFFEFSVSTFFSVLRKGKQKEEQGGITSLTCRQAELQCVDFMDICGNEQGEDISLFLRVSVVLIEKCATHFFEMLDFSFDLCFGGLHLLGKTGFAEIFLRIPINESAIDGDLI